MPGISDEPANPAADGAIVFWYRNYKGEEGYRRAIPISIRYGTSEWHKEPQWLWLMDDTVNGKRREFAMRDICRVWSAVPSSAFPAVVRRPRNRDSKESFANSCC